jgi:hypothetical protein
MARDASGGRNSLRPKARETGEVQGQDALQISHDGPASRCRVGKSMMIPLEFSMPGFGSHTAWRSQATEKATGNICGLRGNWLENAAAFRCLGAAREI